MHGTPLQLSSAVIRPTLDQFCENGPPESECGVVSAMANETVNAEAMQRRIRLVCVVIGSKKGERSCQGRRHPFIAKTALYQW
jgi:hypothetical protein